MANPLSEEKELYERIRKEGIAITEDIWDFIYHRVNDSIVAIILICERWLENKEAMPVQEAGRILDWTKDIKNTIGAITTPSKENLILPQFQNAGSLHPIVQELITHQFGNDIYAIELIVQDAIDYINPAPLPLEALQKIIVHAEAIKGFLEKFRNTVQWKESKEKYHDLYDSFRDGLVMTDMQGHILDVNQAYLNMLNYTKEEIAQLTYQQLTPEKWRKSEEGFVKSLITKKDNSIEYEKEYIKKDGVVFPIDLKVWLIKDAQGNPLGMWGIVRDITERKKAQREFEEDIFASHTVIDNISTGLSLSDKRGRFVIFNHRMQEITGYSMEEINKQGLDAVLYPDPQDRQKVMSRLSQITAGKGTSDVETRIKTKDDMEKIVSVSTSLIKYKGSEMFLSIWRDITESRCLQDALQDSETRFRRLFETAQDGILILDADTGQIREVNPFLIDMLDYSREEFLGKKLWEVGAFIDTDKSKAAFSELQTNGYVRYEDLPLRTKDDRLINVEFVSNVYNVDRTKVIQCNIRDITERKRAEEALAHQTQELVRSNTELERFAYVASHDLHEPLRMVSSYMQLIEERFKDKLSLDAKEFIGFAVDGVNWMQALINDLLAYSRLGTQAKRLELIDCNKVVARVLFNLQIAIQEHNAKVTYDPLMTVMADSSQLEQLFQNLIGNAIKFQAHEPPRVHIAMKEQGSDWVFSVKDNGIGIDPKSSERIFEIFQRLHSRKDYPGTGIGLAICKKIVERHGGHIWVESMPGEGATFYFTIPKTAQR